MSFPANVIPVFGSQRAYADLNFANGSFGLDGRIVNDPSLLSGWSFTRASLAMGYDATGKLTYGPNNLLTYSEQFDNAAWTKTNSTVAQVSGAEWTLTEAATTSRKTLAETTGASQLGKILSIEVKPNGRNYVAIGCTNLGGIWSVYSFNVSTGATVGGYTAGGASAPTNPVITSVGSGWYRVSVVLADANTSMVVMVSNGGDPIFEGYTGNGTSGLLIRKPQLEAVTYQTTPGTYNATTSAAYYGPRLVYDPVTLASLGILVEEARTNLALQSQTLDNASWIKERSSVTANAVTSPDGTTNADKLVEDATAASSHRATLVPTTTAAAWTFSIYAKADTRSWLYIRADRSGVTTPQAWFNVSTGTVGTVQTGFTASIQSVGNGWYRCVATLDTPPAAPNTLIFGLSTGDGVSTYDGDGTSGLYLWQAQAELGTGASSPIPTTTASVTRAGDVVAISGLTIPYPCTIVAGLTRPFATGATTQALSIDNGASTNGAFFLFATAGGLRTQQKSAGSTVADITSAASLTVGTAYGSAARFATDDVNQALAGVLATGDTSAAAPATSTFLRIGQNVDGSVGNGIFSRIRIYNRALSDAQLQSLTS